MLYGKDNLDKMTVPQKNELHSRCLMWAILKWGFLAFRLYPSCFLSFSVCCILIFLHGSFFSNRHLYRSTESWRVGTFCWGWFLVRITNGLLLLQEAPGTTVTLTLTVTIPFLWRLMNRSSQMGWDGQKDRWEFLFLTSVDFSWRFIMRNRLPKRPSKKEIGFTRGRAVVMVFVPGPRIPNCGPA